MVPQSHCAVLQQREKKRFACARSHVLTLEDIFAVLAHPAWSLLRMILEDDWVLLLAQFTVTCSRNMTAAPLVSFLFLLLVFGC